MVDFSKLRVPTREEAEAQRQADAEQVFARDKAERDAACKTAITITLDHEPQMRATTAGETYVTFRGREDKASASLVAVYKLPLRTEQDQDLRSGLDRQLQEMGGGDRMSFAGKWSKRRWKDQAGQDREAWEFKSQHFARGDVTLERMLEKEVSVGGQQASVIAAREATRGAGF